MLFQEGQLLDRRAVQQGATYTVSQSAAWGSCGSQDMCIYGVSITAPTEGLTVTTKRPMFTGAAPNGYTIAIKEGAATLCSAVASGGAYTCTPSTDLAEGTHSVVASTSFNGFTLTASRSFVVNTFTSVAITAPATGTSYVGSSPPGALTGTVEAGAALTVNIGWLGLQRLLTFGGTGYFPARMLREHELNGRLHRVAGVPEFRLPAYLCFPTRVNSEPLALALDTIRRVAADAT